MFTLLSEKRGTAKIKCSHQIGFGTGWLESRNWKVGVEKFYGRNQIEKDPSVLQLKTMGLLNTIVSLFFPLRCHYFSK